MVLDAMSVTSELSEWVNVGSVEKYPYSLEVYECKCGFHIGLDTSFIEQVSDIKIKCPSCGEKLDTKDFPAIS